MKNVKKVVDSFNHLHQHSHTGPVREQVRMISDTVAVSIQYEDTNPPIDNINRGYLVWAASLSVVQIQALFLMRDPLIAMRGCISYGKHVLVNNFLTGPAVDEAAKHYEPAEGALAWLLPSALAQYEAAAALMSGNLLLPYDLPLKSGARLKCLVVNSLYFENSAEQRRKMIRSYDKAMSGVDRLDVWLKRQNTMEFLEIADRKSSESENKV